MRFRFASLLLLMIVCALAAKAQITTGTISGTVKDTSGAVLPGASVAVVSEETGSTRTVQTNAAGFFTAQSLNPGRYKVTASLEGFQTKVQSGIELTLGRDAVINVELPIGAVSQ